MFTMEAHGPDAIVVTRSYGPDEQRQQTYKRWGDADLAGWITHVERDEQARYERYEKLKALLEVRTLTS